MSVTQSFPGFLRRSTNATLGRADLLGLVIGLFVLLGVVLSAGWQARRNVDVLSRSARTQSIRTQINDIMLSALDAETGQRGFLLSEDPSYQGPFMAAIQALPGEIDRLQQMLPNEPRVAELRTAVAGKLIELQHTIDLASSGDHAGAIAVLRTNQGRELMGQIRRLTTALIRDEDGALAEEATEIRHSGQQLVLIDVAGLLAVVGVAVLLGIGIRNDMRRLRAAQERAEHASAQLAASNASLDETVRKRTADLIAANEEIQRFAYIVSHDLRAPLVNIMGFTSELEQSAGQLSKAAAEAGLPAEQREPLAEETAEALRFIKASTGKMDRLINAILKLSREGRRVLTPEKLNMPQLFAELVESMRHQADDREAEVTVATVPNLVGDRVAIEQIFSNVIDNALKYLQPGRPGQIRIAGRMENGLARFDISDNGRGIAPRDYERVFELFRRAGDQTVPGEGIGLAHVRSLVRRLGGSIDCTSELGEGTTFIIRLPPVGFYTKDATA